MRWIMGPCCGKPPASRQPHPPLIMPQATIACVAFTLPVLACADHQRDPDQRAAPEPGAGLHPAAPPGGREGGRCYVVHVSGGGAVATPIPPPFFAAPPVSAAAVTRCAA